MCIDFLPGDPFHKPSYRPKPPKPVTLKAKKGNWKSFLADLKANTCPVCEQLKDLCRCSIED